MTSFFVICGLGLPQSKILGTPMNKRSPEKLFFKLFFENSCGCVLGPWPRTFLSLASRGSVLGKAVLGLGLGFFCVLGLGLEPVVLDSTSGSNPLLFCSKKMAISRFFPRFLCLLLRRFYCAVPSQQEGAGGRALQTTACAPPISVNCKNFFGASRNDKTTGNNEKRNNNQG